MQHGDQIEVTYFKQALFVKALAQLKDKCSNNEEYIIATQTLEAVARRPIDHPNEPKFRSICTNNLQFQERIGVHGAAAEQCMLLVGFTIENSRYTFETAASGFDGNWASLNSAKQVLAEERSAMQRGQGAQPIAVVDLTSRSHMTLMASTMFTGRVETTFA